MYRTILVPLDGSAFGEQALSWGVGIARRAGARLEVVTVQVPVAPMYGGTPLMGFEATLDERLRAESRAYLEGVAKRLAVCEFPVTTALLEGEVAEALQGRAAALGADLIVMTTHGRGPLARAWLGSVATDLVRRAPVPVLLVRPEDGPADLNRELALRHILIPLDGSAVAEEIIEPAVTLGALTECEYTLARVIPPMVIGYNPPETVTHPQYQYSLLEELKTLHQEDRKQAQAYLDGVAGRLRTRSVRVWTRLLVHDQPAVALLAELKERPADLVALATHGRRGLPRLFLGSVADKIVRAASVPVLVQRPAQAR